MDAVRPVAAYTSAIITAVKKVSKLTLTPEAATELQALQQYFLFLALLMSYILLSAIDEQN